MGHYVFPASDLLSGWARRTPFKRKFYMFSFVLKERMGVAIKQPNLTDFKNKVKPLTVHTPSPVPAEQFVHA